MNKKRAADFFEKFFNIKVHLVDNSIGLLVSQSDYNPSIISFLFFLLFSSKATL